MNGSNNKESTMNNPELPPALLRDRFDQPVPLLGVTAFARLRGPMAEVSVEQRYRNAGDTNIEAVYTFPLPLDAVLLSLELEIGGRRLVGTIIERKQAERAYEDAVTDGDSAAMLEEAGPGLYTVSLGNLLAGETAAIRYRYGALLNWRGDELRFFLPTTIAPRYGDAEAAGLQPHQVPTASLQVNYPLDLTIHLEGELADATVASPSHRLAITRSEAGLEVRPAELAALDRDFVLTLESTTADTRASSCVATPDGSGFVTLASLRVPARAEDSARPLAIKIVIDCSGSMAGVSMHQARKAALEILDQLLPGDLFNVTLFGSTHRSLFRRLMPATAANLAKACEVLATLQADMGGTEMEQALAAAFDLRGGAGEANVLLITDGEIYEHERLVRRAAQSGHRVFTVGVGHAVAEAFLTRLAAKTGGACELVAPQEGMSERVLQQFQRMRQPKLDAVSLNWPAPPVWTTPLPVAVFAGDTVQVFAGFTDPVDGHVNLHWHGTGLPTVSAAIQMSPEAELPRLAAARRLTLVDAATARSLALQYQLVSLWTNCLVVAERAAKAEDLPLLTSVPQMLAAGWGGVGVQDLSHMRSCMPRASVRAQSAPAAAPYFDMLDTSGVCYDIEPADNLLDLAAVTKLAKPRIPGGAGPGHSPQEFLHAMKADLKTLFRIPALPDRIDGLEAWGLDGSLAAELRRLVAEGHDEAAVVAAFLYAFAHSGEFAGLIDRQVLRAILKGWKLAAPTPQLQSELTTGLAGCSLSAWHWAETCGT
jgi:Ca-activated chloride channel family protein